MRNTTGFKQFAQDIGHEQMMELPQSDLVALAWRKGWLKKARPKQLPPKGNWLFWLIMAGRGFGKTLTGAQSIAWLAWRQPGSLNAVVARTHDDLRRFCFNGPSGLLSVIPPELIEDFNKSLLEITLINGSKIMGFTAEEPDKLRGPNHHNAWLDEFAAWKNPNDVLDQVMFGLRLGSAPRCIITTTPRPINELKELIKLDDTVVTRGSTYENSANLSESSLGYYKRKYENTRLGLQELYGELLEEAEGSIFIRSEFRLWPHVKRLPEFDYILQSYDTAFTEKMQNDRTAATTWGVFKQESTGWGALLLDAWADRMTYPNLRPKMISEYANSFYGENDKGIDVVLIEEKGSGISLTQDLQSSGLPVFAYNPGRASKLERAHVVSYLPGNGMIWVPESRHNHGKPMSWAVDWLDELTRFTGVEAKKGESKLHDDYVDSTTQAWRLLMRQGYLVSSDEVPLDEDEEQSYQVYENPYGV